MPCVRPALIPGLLACLLLAACGGGGGGGGGERYGIGGTVTGLTGTVTLRVNGGAPLAVSANGAFELPDSVAAGADYLVSIVAQPTDQTCTLTNAAGTAVADVTDVAVNCTINGGATLRSVGGTLSGLASGSVALRINGTGEIVLTADGAFNFVNAVNNGGSYAVTVQNQPVGQLCTVGNGSGTATADVTNVTVSCSIRTYPLRGTLSGLTGSVTLQNQGTDDLTLIANGVFTFPTQIAHGATYLVSVLTPPANHTCTVTNGSGTALGTVTNVGVACALNNYTIGGTVSGLLGTVVLRNTGGNLVNVNANGNFSFIGTVAHGGSYNVTIDTQPTGQICSVASGSGTATANVSTVAVTCVSKTYGLGGNLSGMTAGTITLQNQGGDDLTLVGNGNFVFPTQVAYGNSYLVSVLTPPANHGCSLFNASGTLYNTVTNVRVVCALNTYVIGGTVSGLIGSVVLRNNGINPTTVAANGSFAFSTRIAHGSTYSVSIGTQPTGQSCSVTAGSGTATDTVSDVAITCVSDTHTVGGTVNGLSGEVTLRNNGGDDITLDADGGFTFPQALAYTAAYQVTVATQPAGQECAVSNAGGTIGTSDITDIVVTCLAEPPGAPSPVLTGGPNPRELFFDWPDVAGATYYRLLKDPDGASGYTQVGGDLTVSQARDQIRVLEHDWSNALYRVDACNGFGCSSAAPLGSGAALTRAIGYIKASNTGANDGFGTAVALSGDGRVLAVGAPCESSDNATGNNNNATCAGAVYVYQADDDGQWSLVKFYKAPLPDSGDNFGSALALSADGNTLAVGAPGEASDATGIGGDATDDSLTGAGAVYVFTRSSGTWQPLQAYIKASNTDAGDNFGGALSLSDDGNTLAVGALQEDSVATGIDGDQASDASESSGAVYVFSRSGSTWSQQAYVKASNTDAGDRFGATVALAGNGDTLAVGAVYEDSFATTVNGNQADNLAGDAGAVYVFTRSAGIWTQQAYVKPTNTGAGDLFGAAVALSTDGDTLAVGAATEDSAATGIDGSGLGNSATDAGAAYVFSRSGGIWSQTAYVKASNTGAGDLFGLNLALSGDGNVLAVGALAEAGSSTALDGSNSNDAAAAGAVYWYVRDGGIWSQERYVKASNTNAQDRFSNAVAVAADGSALAVGADGEDGSGTGLTGSPASNGTAGAGAVYLY